MRTGIDSARDLHDHVIQRLFGVGLHLQGLATRVPMDVSDALEKQMKEVDEIIGEIRGTTTLLVSISRVRGS